MKTTTLKNGLRVCNFSSPHSYTFDCGTILEANSPEIARAFMLEAKELCSINHINGVEVCDIELKYELTIDIATKLMELQEREDIDIILVPFPVMNAIKDSIYNISIPKARVCRLADRVTKVIFSNKFCI